MSIQTFTPKLPMQLSISLQLRTMQQRSDCRYSHATKSQMQEISDIQPRSSLNKHWTSSQTRKSCFMPDSFMKLHSNSEPYHFLNSGKKALLSCIFLDKLQQSVLQFTLLCGVCTADRHQPTLASLPRCPNTCLKNTINCTSQAFEVHKKTINLITLEDQCDLT